MLEDPIVFVYINSGGDPSKIDPNVVKFSWDAS